MSEDNGYILVADDNRMNRMKLSHSLEQQGYRVALAENGVEALEMVRDADFDVLLLDILMPKVDGYQVLEKMKEDPDLRNIPVIVISALDEIDSAVRCIEMGAEDYLPKPFNPVFLKARLEASLRRKRLRDLEQAFVKQETTLRQNEKLATLGKMSAGMAHELNNPAAATQRGAAQLRASFAELQQIHLRLGELGLSEEQLHAMLALDEQARTRAVQPQDLDSLARSDREAAVEAWLDNHGVPDAWDIAPTLVNLGYNDAQLGELAGSFDQAQFPAVIDWLDASYTIYSLLGEIASGAGRIAELVKALKSYAYLDQAPLQTVDVHEGLDDTLLIMRGKLKHNVDVTRDYDANLPRIEAYGSELNQVWTNLIDNAIDAMEESSEPSRLTLRTRHDDRWVIVEVEDNGPGIPPDIIANIFDPFFTTKSVGKGSGMGLNISHNIVVQRHNGRFEVMSEAGRTVFEVRLPRHLSTTEAQ